MFNQSMSMETNTKKARPKTIVLVVDDYRSLARALETHIGPTVDDVYTAGSVWEAQYILESVPITHLLCDMNIPIENDFSLISDLNLQDIGNQQRKVGFELAPQWRREHASIRRVVIYTGEDTRSLPRPDGVDAVVCKTDIDRVIEALLDRGPEISSRRGS